MLIRYAYGEEGTIFYQEYSNLIPRIGETIIFDEIDYSRCAHKFSVMNNGNNTYTRVYGNEYIIDDVPEMLTVIDVCYSLGNEEPIAEITVENYFDKFNEYHLNDDYMENLAKDVNMPNDFR
ncbi:MAG: hypothetical protein KBT27_01005 [Prevotellaceae bacterium]|nr:hypothetical protein [Candidatus Faecinaster equi]